MIEPKMVADDLLDDLLDAMQGYYPGMDRVSAVKVVRQLLLDLCKGLEEGE